MKKVINFGLVIMLAFVIVYSSGCKLNDSKQCKTAESIELSSAVLAEVEFENSESVKLKQECDEVEISGSIDAMTDAQKSAYGVQDVTHVVCVKLTFDKERTISSFKLQGNVVKVFSTNNTDENYVGSLTDLLDNQSGEDAYANLILSANTKDYTLTTKYTDGHESVIELEIDAVLASATLE